jgi:hypothetical protein
VDGSLRYLLAGAGEGLAPPGCRLLVCEPRADGELWAGWAWRRCLGLLGRGGAEALLRLGHAHCRRVHLAGGLDDGLGPALRRGPGRR